MTKHLYTVEEAAFLDAGSYVMLRFAVPTNMPDGWGYSVWQKLEPRTWTVVVFGEGALADKYDPFSPGWDRRTEVLHMSEKNAIGLIEAVRLAGPARWTRLAARTWERLTS